MGWVEGIDPLEFANSGTDLPKWMEGSVVDVVADVG